MQLVFLGWVAYNIYKVVRRQAPHSSAEQQSTAAMAIAPQNELGDHGVEREGRRAGDDQAVGQGDATSRSARAEAVEGQLRVTRSRFVKHDDPLMLAALDEHVSPSLSQWRERFTHSGGATEGKDGALAARWLADIERRSDALRVVADALVNRAVLDRMVMVERMQRSLVDAMERGAASVGATTTRRAIVAVPDQRGAPDVWSQLVRDAMILAVPDDLDTNVDAWHRVAWTAAWRAFQAVDGLPTAAVGAVAALALDPDVEGATADADVQRAMHAAAAVLAWDWMSLLLFGPAAVHALRRQAAGHERRIWWTEGSPPPVELRLYVTAELLYDLGHAEEANALERSLAAHTRVDLVVVASGAGHRELAFGEVVEAVAAVGAAWLRAQHDALAGASLLDASGLSLSAAARSRARHAVQSLEGAGSDVALAGVPARELWAAMWEAALVRPHNAGLFVRAARRAGERAATVLPCIGAAMPKPRRGVSRADIRAALPLLDLASARGRAGQPSGRFAVDARRPLR